MRPPWWRSDVLMLKPLQAVFGACGSLALVVLAGGVAWGQTQVVVQPSVTVSVAYDDNLFIRVPATSDTVLRITPSIHASRSTPRLALFGSYSLDVERYQDHPDLTTGHARQGAVGRITYTPSTRTTFGVTTSYDASRFPYQVNLSTGLATARIPSWHWSAGSDWSHRVSQRMGVAFSYSFLVDSVSSGLQAQTNQGSAALTRALSTRDQLRVRYFIRRFTFTGGSSLISQGAVLGWTRQITRVMSLTLEGGPSFTDGTRLVRPEVTAQILRQLGPGSRNGLALAYTRSQTSAAGLLGTIDVQRVEGSFSHQSPRGISGSARAAFYRNLFAGSAIQVYQVGGDIQKYFANMLAVTANYSFNIQRDERSAQAVALPFHRNVIAVGLTFTPWPARAASPDWAGRPRLTGPHFGGVR